MGYSVNARDDYEDYDDDVTRCVCGSGTPSSPTLSTLTGSRGGSRRFHDPV